MKLRAMLCAATMLAVSKPAIAAPPKPQPGDPVTIGDGLTLDPIIDARLRYEHVDTPALDADAATLRLRAGAELKHKSGFAVLVEGEGNLALDKGYNAFPFAINDSQRRPGFAVVPDPMTIELNRAQLQYKSKALTLTAGRQRIALDDQRFVGNSGWRQNEQTFDAARAEVKLGPISLDGTYAISLRTFFGIDAGPRQAYDGNFVFLGAGAKFGPVQFKAFSYLLDYDPAEQLGSLALNNADTQTYGARATASFPLGKQTKLNLAASYARQSNWQQNPVRYSADYFAGEANLVHGGLGLIAGYEQLGTDNGRAFQTPLATLHKFNGWADLFLTTPANGLLDWYGGISSKFPKVTALPGLNAAVAYHRFDSDAGSLHYGDEWDASLGFKRGRVSVLAKFADYQADRFGTDTQKFWLQFELSY